jgi:hypothetical protein
MKKQVLYLIFIIILTGCKNENSGNNQLFVSKSLDSILNEYVKINKLRQKVDNDSFYLSKQSYEISFFKKEYDTIAIIGRMPFYASDFFAGNSNSFLERRLDLKSVELTQNPIYMGSFQYKNNPVHVYDVRDKVGKKEYFFDNLKTEDFKEYYIKEQFIGDTMASFWIYKIKNRKFILEKKTKPYVYE